MLIDSKIHSWIENIVIMVDTKDVAHLPFNEVLEEIRPKGDWQFANCQNSIADIHRFFFFTRRNI